MPAGKTKKDMKVSHWAAHIKKNNTYKNLVDGDFAGLCDRTFGGLVLHTAYSDDDADRVGGRRGSDARQGLDRHERIRLARDRRIVFQLQLLCTFVLWWLSK
jgi:hypothetical protein